MDGKDAQDKTAKPVRPGASSHTKLLKQTPERCHGSGRNTQTNTIKHGWTGCTGLTTTKPPVNYESSFLREQCFGYFVDSVYNFGSQIATYRNIAMHDLIANLQPLQHLIGTNTPKQFGVLCDVD